MGHYARIRAGIESGPLGHRAVLSASYDDGEPRVMTSPWFPTEAEAVARKDEALVVINRMAALP